MTELTPQAVWQKYDQGQRHLQQIELHDTVKKANRFYNGDQWEGLNAPDLEKPVINVFKPNVNYLVSQVASDDIGIDLRPQVSTSERDELCEIFKDEIEDVLENTKAKQKSRELLRDACVEGTGVWYWYYDKGTGEICRDQIKCNRILFDNPYKNDIQKQRGFIIEKRLTVEEARMRAAACGLSKEEVESLTEDNAGESYHKERSHGEGGFVTFLMRFYKAKEPQSERETVHFYECVRDKTIAGPYDMKLDLYPVATYLWEHVDDSAYGASAIAPFIPNQIFINKMLALSQAFLHKMAFPQRIYNSSYFPDGLKIRPGGAIATTGNPKDVVWTDAPAGNISPQVVELIDKDIEYIKNGMGVSDAALGNIRADNSAAIVALQRTTAMPLQMQKGGFNQFWEDDVRIILDLMRVNYGIREIAGKIENEETGDVDRVVVKFDFNELSPGDFKLHVEVGEAAYWSEVTAVQTLDKIAEKLPDPLYILELYPEKVIPEKNKMLKKIKELRRQEAQDAAFEAQQSLPTEGNIIPPTDNSMPAPAEAAATEELAKKIKNI